MQEKESRICSRKYQHNDLELRRRSTHDGDESVSHLSFQDFLGHFVFPDDAQEIKKHPFFRGIDWEHLHEIRPPEVPVVDSKTDTRYFEEGSTVSDMAERSSSSNLTDEELAVQEALIHNILQTYQEDDHASKGEQHGGGLDGQYLEDVLRGDKEGVFDEDLITIAQNVLREEGEKHRRRRERRRPRDRILRDRAIAKEAMELRKKGAFLGYEYLRPPNLLVGAEPEKKPETVGTRFRRPQFPTFASLSRFHRPLSQG